MKEAKKGEIAAKKWKVITQERKFKLSSSGAMGEAANCANADRTSVSETPDMQSGTERQEGGCEEGDRDVLEEVILQKKNYH